MFKKISQQQFERDHVDIHIEYDKIKLPKRATLGSAGYDIYSVCDFTLLPGEEIKLPTGIKVEMNDNFFLMIVPRSGLGFKYGVRLKNSVAIIDSDYINSDNEGHIWIKLDYPVLLNCEQKPMVIKQGEAICQGIILPFGKFIDEDTDFQVRNGGFGSTSIN